MCSTASSRESVEAGSSGSEFVSGVVYLVENGPISTIPHPPRHFVPRPSGHLSVAPASAPISLPYRYNYTTPPLCCQSTLLHDFFIFRFLDSLLLLAVLDQTTRRNSLATPIFRDSTRASSVIELCHSFPSTAKIHNIAVSK